MTSLNRMTSLEISASSEKLAQEILKLQYARQSRIWDPYGQPGQLKSLRDTQYHLDYLAKSLATSSPDLFINYIDWVQTLFDGLNFQQDVVTVTLDCIRQALQANLSADMFEAAVSYINAAEDELQQSHKTPPLFIREDLPLGGLAKDYLDTLLSGNRKAASTMILDAAKSGVPIKDLYLHVFQRSQYEIGRLWQTNKVSVAQEHFCTAATQLIMSQLYQYVFSTKKVGLRYLGTCVGGELHELGARMIADFFEMEGWDTYYLGANTPTNSILRTLEEQEVDVLGISATMTLHIDKVVELIEQVRGTKSGKDIKILVGGYPFIIAEDLWNSVGADGFGQDASAAITAAYQLLES